MNCQPDKFMHIFQTIISMNYFFRAGDNFAALRKNKTDAQN